MLASASLSRNCYDHSVINTSWDVDLYNLLASYDSVTAASLTLVLDNVTFTAASRAGSLGLHGSEHRADGTNGVTCAVTSRTGLRLRTTLASSTVARRTCYVLANLELLGATCKSLFQSKLSLYTQVSTLILLWLGTSSAKSAETATESTVTAEDVAKHREDVVHVHACATAETAKSSLRTVESKLIVLLALLRIVKNLVSFGSFLEFILCLLVTRVAVWMIFDGYLAVSLLNFVF